MTWRDATKEAPPRNKLVLVWFHAEPRLAVYRASASVSKGCELPNPGAYAVWCVDSTEGVFNIRWWAIIEDPEAGRDGSGI